jgi:hypothetical protein
MVRIKLDTDVKVILPDGSTHQLGDYLLPTAVLMLSALLLMTSIFLPYWSMKLVAPQYPKGLTVDVYINHLEGDIKEVDALNHYLGMPKLDEGGQLERSISMIAIITISLLLIGAVFIHNQWAALLAVPVIAFPFIFLADLYLILYRYGHSIDPKSALGGAIDPFTPKIIGEGSIGQFSTVASLGPGLYLAFAAGIVVLIGLWLHRAAYRPLVEARKKVAAAKRAEASA